MGNRFDISPQWSEDVLKSYTGVLPTGDNSSIGTGDTWSNFQSLLKISHLGGQTFTTDIISTYSLVISGSPGYLISYNSWFLSPVVATIN